MRHLGRGIAREGGAFVIDDPAGKVAGDLERWQPLPDPPDGLIVMVRDVAPGSELKILDRRGTPREPG